VESTSIAGGLAWDGLGSTSMAVWLHPGEVAAGLELPWEVLNILVMSPVEAHLARGVLAFTMVQLGLGAGPRQPKGAPPGDLKGCAPEGNRLKRKRGKIDGIKLNLIQN